MVSRMVLLGAECFDQLAKFESFQLGRQDGLYGFLGKSSCGSEQNSVAELF